MRTSIAWRNALHDKRRTLAAMSGIAFAILLMFMQLGFSSACRSSATRTFDVLDFDAILVSTSYVNLRDAGAIPRNRLVQASGAPGVRSVSPLYVSSGLWRNVANGVRREILVLGVDPADRPFRIEQINRCVPLLAVPDTAVVDRIAKPVIGPHHLGTVTELNGRRIRVVGAYRRGTGLIADGTLLVSDLTMANLLGAAADPASGDDRPQRHRLRARGILDRVQLGLVRLAPHADRAVVLRALQSRLPEDTRVWSREALEDHEQGFIMNVKPVGFMFRSGVLVGFLVGAVILYQILSADIAKHVPQFATLKAMGYGSGYLRRIVIQQGLLFAVFGYCPALALSFGLYAVVRALADLPAYMTFERAAVVFALSVAMCIVSGLLAVRKVNLADPADLY